MSGAPALTTLLLPPRSRFAGQALPPALARRLGRGDRLDDRQSGGVAQLQRHFELLPRGCWPMAAITRARDADDAHLHAWLRADPACARPDMTGVRVLAIGELGLSADEAEALLQPLRPLFGDAGFRISAPVPSRWYLSLPLEARLPAFSHPEDGLGGDLFEYLPDGPEGRRWRALLNEAQVILHNHPVNLARAEAGRPVANSLWFWGGGRLPDRVRSPHTGVASRESELLSLAALAELPVGAGPQASLIDLRGLRELAALSVAMEDALGRSPEVCLDFADGAAWRIRPGQGWRWWRRRQAALA
ncbi:phosphoglycerate mutase [Arenimonas fontis]|uniref:Phosphoglycerate mutase n=1 Tax=Arenimonas fontis TaxID=2608255 RepID=A0A5B2ZEP1_9GAMM|nr:phosphoglycerate mutase [Arenimonas fontis]KAA2286043.1 phosphoglycerate mutase [Arenimonas fontis]